ncbi:hypothetical protein KEG57_26845 [Polyangium jinanense]|uniref:Uncharacterized protein n=1 Tax=Polyangium jinanense TaxID=2829994 RepID=A0A9X4AU25_9BACT|nr:hypothetical protein [Polyangium jinanense]
MRGSSTSRWQDQEQRCQSKWQRGCLGFQGRRWSCLDLFDELRIAQFIDPGSSPWLVRVQGRTAPGRAWGEAPATRLQEIARIASSIIA